MKFFKKILAKFIKDKTAREKRLADINNKPWVEVLDVVMADPANPTSGFFELDWNQAFIDSLIAAGYSGRNDDELMEQWFNDLCRGVIGDNLDQLRSKACQMLKK